jgi:hypothetical protein
MVYSRCFSRPNFSIFAGGGARPGPPPRRFDVGRLPRRPFAIPVCGRRRAPFPRRSAAIFLPIFALCGGPGSGFRPLGDVRGRSRRRRSIGRPRLSIGLSLTRNASGAPFSRYRARKVRKRSHGTCSCVRRGPMGYRTVRSGPGIPGLCESDSFPRSSLALVAGIVAADLEIFGRKRSIFRRFFGRRIFTSRVRAATEVSLERSRRGASFGPGPAFHLGAFCRLAASERSIWWFFVSCASTLDRGLLDFGALDFPRRDAST